MLNKIKLLLLKTTQKKIIIGFLSFFIITSFHSSLIFADSISSGSGTFTYGRYEYQKNIYSSITNINIDGTSINSYGTIVIDIYLYNTYTGNLYINGITGTGYINGGSYYCYGASFGNFDTDNNKITLFISNPTDHVKVVYTINANDMYNFITNSNVAVTGNLVVSDDVETTVSDIDIKLSSCSNTLQQILTALQSGGDIYEFLDDINTYIQYINSLVTTNNTLLSYQNTLLDQYDIYIHYFELRINDTALTGYPRVIFNQNDLNNYYYYGDLDDYTIRRFDIRTYQKLFNGNYASFTFYFKSNTEINNNWWEYINWRFRDNNGILCELDEKYIYYSSKLSYDDQKYYCMLTIYIPIYSFTTYDTSSYNLNLSASIAGSANYLTNIIKVGVIYHGVVENLPDEIPNNIEQSSIENDLEQTASDINDAASQSSAIEEQYISDLTDFKNNLDLSDYDFSLHSNSGFTYIKEKLQDIYEINEFKPFYLVPIIFMVLTVILGG